MTPTRVIGSQDLLDFPDGVGMLAYTWRWDVLSPSLDVIDSIRVTGNPSIRFSPRATICRQCSGATVITEEIDELNLYRVRIRPVMVLEDSSEQPFGVFVAEKREDTTTQGRELTELVMWDQDSIIDEELQNTFGIPTGGALDRAMVELLERSNIANYEIPPGGTAGDALQWPAGTSKKVVLGDLAEMKGCLPPAFDRFGTYVCKPIPNLAPGVGADFYYNEQNSRVVRDTIRKSTNLSVPNVHTVINIGSADHGIVGSAKVDRTLPFSVEVTGRKRVKVWRIQGVESTGAAIQIAKTKASTGGIGNAEITFQTHVDPRHDVWSRVIRDDEAYLESDWSANVAVGATMSHTATKAVATEDS